MVALNIGLELFLLMALGFFIKRARLLPDDFESGVSKFILRVSLPCLIVRSLNIEFDPGQLLQLGQTILISCGTIVLFFILGQLAYLLCGRDATGRIVRFGIMFSNYTFVGIPTVEAIYGEAGLFIFTVLTLPVRLIYYVSPQFLLRSKEARSRSGGTPKERIKGLFTPPTVSVFVGLLLYFTGLRLPGFLSQSISMVASVSSPLGMIICGMTLAKLDLRDLFKSPRILILVIIRNIIAPALALLLLLALRVDADIIRVVILYAGLPAASLLPTFALQYEDSPQTASIGSAGVFISTILSILTLPVWSAALNVLL